MAEFELRPYHASDLVRLYDICLATGDAGQDATGLLEPELLGHYFLAPYCWDDAGLCFVLTQHEIPLGYIVATADSRGFARRCEVDWWPVLRRRYPLQVADSADTLSSARLIQLIHAGYSAPNYANEYPAHLHIDLLPKAQGEGQGRRMMDRLLSALAEREIPGLHLGVGRSNPRAISFYRRYGFHEIEAGPAHLVLGIRIDPRS